MVRCSSTREAALYPIFTPPTRLSWILLSPAFNLSHTSPHFTPSPWWFATIVRCEADRAALVQASPRQTIIIAFVHHPAPICTRCRHPSLPSPIRPVVYCLYYYTVEYT
ncbi:hypothetical protein BDM02DRAFT_3124826 [Thelephora ganbajun]|uniref:Uncharacterized protein n=1 Tax=Thelephora ganbajun TaxID=370292 RepID=A0ACB6YXE0_THEGA|nr:hypothetical protein BDM02DRAFT_3124826 [Thelephora ganbajun]